MNRESADPVPRSGQFDPWATGTRGYRIALLSGMALTFAGLITVIIVAVLPAPAELLRSLGLILLGTGLLTHLVGLGLRKRQARDIIRHNAPS